MIGKDIINNRIVEAQAYSGWFRMRTPCILEAIVQRLLFDLAHYDRNKTQTYIRAAQDIYRTNRVISSRDLTPWFPETDQEPKKCEHSRSTIKSASIFRASAISRPL